MRIEYGVYRWVGPALTGPTIDVVRNYDRINEQFGIKPFRVPARRELVPFWNLNHSPLELSPADPGELLLRIFGPQVVKYQVGLKVKHEMYSPVIVVSGHMLYRVADYRQALMEEASTLANTHGLRLDRRRRTLSFPPSKRYAVRAKIYPV